MESFVPCRKNPNSARFTRFITGLLVHCSDDARSEGKKPAEQTFLKNGFFRLNLSNRLAKKGAELGSFAPGTAYRPS